jgi:hypothetical protein
MEMRGILYHKSTQVLAYADDVDIIGRSVEAVKEAPINLEKTANE